MRIGWVATFLWLSACSTAPASFAPQNSVESAPVAWAELVRETGGSTDLLGLVSNTAIEPWLDKMLAENPGLQRSMFELVEAGWLTRQARAARLPSASLAADASRERKVTSNKTTGTNYGLTLSSSRELDVWGRLADSQSASELDESALAADFIYAQRSLAASFIKRWLTWVNEKKVLAVEKARLKTLAFNETVVRERYQSGLGRLQDVETARVDTKQALANVAAQEESLAISKRRLQALLGVIKPIGGLPEHWPDIHFPKVELPAYSMGQRPDLMAAYQRIRTADKRSIVAFKSLLPGFNLSFDLTQNRRRSSDLLSTDPAWLLLGQLIQPLFQGGRLRAELKSAEQRAGQAYWAYREQLLAALLEVEAGLSQEQSLERQYVALNQAFKHAQASQQQFEQRYRQGLVPITDLLDAQQTTFDIQSSLLLVTLNRANNRIDLGLALGLPIKKGA